jgi:hypothetical protein
LLARWRAKFSSGCCDSCSTPKSVSAACCDDCGHGGGLFNRWFNKQSDCCDSCTTSHKTTSCDSCCDSPSLFDRIRARFHKDDCCDSCSSCSSCGSAPAAHAAPATGGATKDAETIQKMPKETTTPKKEEVRIDTTPVLTPASTVIKTETKHPFELNRRYEKRVDRAADFSWLTGQLFFVHADGGLWVLRYAPLWKEDSNGGGVVLARDRDMNTYREGDLVTVHGEILQQKGSVFLGGPLYRAHAIELIERPQQ